MKKSFKQHQRKYDNLTPEDIYGKYDERFDEVMYILDNCLTAEEIQYIEKRNIVPNLLNEENADFDEDTNRVYKGKLSVNEIVEKVKVFLKE